LASIEPIAGPYDRETADGPAKSRRAPDHEDGANQDDASTVAIDQPADRQPGPAEKGRKAKSR
jgi:hypothetical protein